MKKILFAIAAIMFISTPLFVSADTVSELRLQLQQVLTRIAELQQELALLKSGVTPTTNGGVCINLTRNLSLGMENSEVRALQEFLARDASIYPEAIVSGYYGTLTQLAVQRWQARRGIVSSGTPSTTGYGAVGPRTRVAMNDTCGGDGSGNIVTFAFAGGTLQAPADAALTLTMLEDACMSYKIDWGDGSTWTALSAAQSTNCGVVQTHTLVHRYTSGGTFTAKIYAAKGPLSAVGEQPVTSAVVTVFSGQPYVRVLSPNGGETLRLGDTVPVRWEVANQPADSAVALYIVGPNGTYRFAKRSHDNRSFNWIVGDRVCDANGCDIQLPVSGSYQVRAALYSPASACIGFCEEGDVSTPTFLATDDSDGYFNITNIGSGGATPLYVAQSTGQAPFTVGMTVNLEPSTAATGGFEVDFGDGSGTYKITIPPGESGVITKKFSHTYSQDGKYYIRLRPMGASQYIAERKIIVEENSFSVTPSTNGYVPLIARATYNTDTGCSHAGEITRVYTIDWGDYTETSRYEVTVPQCSSSASGVQSLSERIETHAYTLPGAYAPRLRIDADDSYTSIVEEVDVNKPDFTVSPSFGFKPLRVTASYTADVSCVFGATTSVAYTIDWGDGSAKNTYTKTLNSCDGDTFALTTEDKSYAHTYEEIGDYTVTLTVRKDNIGTSYKLNRNVVVDKSALRNGMRAVAQAIDVPAIQHNMAAALNAVFSK